jgi:hypothetical protein
VNGRHRKPATSSVSVAKIAVTCAVISGSLGPAAQAQAATESDILAPQAPAPAEPALPPVVPPVLPPPVLPPVLPPVEAVPATGVPHLPSPDNPPPGTSTVPAGQPGNPNVSYLRDLWQALRNDQIDRNDLLLALAQRSFTGQIPVDGTAPAPVPPPPPAG